MLKSEIIERTKDYSYIIWDWNGTLIDDVEIALKSVNSLLTENNLPKIDKKKYRDTFGFPIQDYYEEIGFDLNSISFDHLCERFHQEYNKYKIKSGKLFSDTKDHLQYFYENKKQSILSAGAQWYLNDWVKSYEIGQYFEHIFGINDDKATSKIYRGKELITKIAATEEKIILIGDTDHDLEVGQSLEIDVLLVANGHQSYQRLKSVHDNVIESRLN